MTSWLERILTKKRMNIFCAGAGDSFLVDKLLSLGQEHIIANDISAIALEKIKQRVTNPEKIMFYKEDLLSPKIKQNFEDKLDVWIDRATLHFFTSCSDKDTYFDNLHRCLKQGGMVIIGVFSKNNVPKCCGLDLQLWSLDSLANRLSGFTVLDSFAHNFKEQNGKMREFIYLLAQKK